MSDNFETEFKNSMKELHFSSGERKRLLGKLLQTEKVMKEREVIPMKKWTLGRTAAVVAACLVITGATAFGASKITSFMATSNPGQEYHTADEMSAAQAEMQKHSKNTSLRFPEFPDSFSTGYKFSSGNTVQVDGRDEEDHTVGEWEDLSAEYKNSAGNSVSIEMSYHPGETPKYAATEERTIKGVKMRFDYDEYLELPDESYELDAATKKRMEKGEHFYVSYGSSEKKTEFFSSVSFTKDGIFYLIDTFDDVDREELFSMAEELIGR
ncbi:MAG: hypothetical protein IJ733_16750 [Lachnospiraceae bacterium]|nr:hypothetical protein [Lachnospiraceae bacterium]